MLAGTELMRDDSPRTSSMLQCTIVHPLPHNFVLARTACSVMCGQLCKHDCACMGHAEAEGSCCCAGWCGWGCAAGPAGGGCTERGARMPPQHGLTPLPGCSDEGSQASPVCTAQLYSACSLRHAKAMVLSSGLVQAPCAYRSACTVVEVAWATVAVGCMGEVMLKGFCSCRLQWELL